ncbi:hypothetical protein ACQW5G_01385 [Fructilactobacillus sp. Tb1]|uniref:hypothetical protein n=1 Tax=Fructilactobacillus sp. Tb1 TaxID=3422304 RepID=UPI003D2C4265
MNNIPDFCMQVVPEDAVIADDVPYFYLNGDKSIRVIGKPISKKDQETMYKVLKNLRKKREAMDKNGKA